MPASASLLPAFYFPPVSWFVAAYPASVWLVDAGMPYRRQQYFNRCNILTSAGMQKLSIPVRKATRDTAVADIMPDGSRSWQRLHLRAMETAYGRSPYFLYFRDELARWMERSRSMSLGELNLASVRWLVDMVRLDRDVVPFSHLAHAFPGIPDHRRDFAPAFSLGKSRENPLVPYRQVFSEHMPFVPDLSVLDLLFNLGPELPAYLNAAAAR